MKKITIILIAISCFAVACKDSKKTKETDGTRTAKNLDPQADHDLKLYTQAMNRADVPSAIYALNSYLMRDSSQPAYKDTLLELYKDRREMAAIFVLSGEMLTKKPNDTSLLILYVQAAGVLNQLGFVTDKCLRLTEMFPNEDEYKFQYAEALLQSRNTAGAEAILLAIINDPNSAKKTTIVTAQDDNGQLRQSKINTKVGALLKLGQIKMLTNNLDEAEKIFSQASQITPNDNNIGAAILEVRRLKAAGK